MKKLLLFVFLFVAVANSYSQKAPGKEETIAWLKEKLEKCLEGTYSYSSQVGNGPWQPEGKVEALKLESINECEFVLTYMIDGENFRAKFPTGIASIKSVTEDTEILPFPCTTFNYTAGVIEKINLTTANSQYDNYILAVHIALREDDIHARIEKAMKHLPTFCPKKKETF